MLEFILLIAISYLSIKVLILYAHRLKLLDIPNERSHHCSIVPRGGGVGFVLSFFIITFMFHTQIFIENWYIFASIFSVFIIGIVDDRYCVSAKLKFIVIFIAVFLLWLNGLSINTLGSWFNYDIYLPSFIALLFGMFALSGFTNALNLIDGLDGLSTTISIIIILFFGLIAYENSDNLMLIISINTIAVLIGFLLLNWNPAKVFMGDSGSLTLGFIVSVLALLSLQYIHPIVIVYLVALPILDTLIVMIRRIRRKKSPFSPDKTHIHHILVKFFENRVKRTVIFIAILQILFSSIGYILITITKNDTTGIVPLFALIIFTMMFLLFYMIFTGIKRRQILLDKL